MLVSDSFVAILLSNTLYLASWLGYSYITVLGYMSASVRLLVVVGPPHHFTSVLLSTALPFLHKTNMLFMPVFGLAVVYLLAVILGYSMTHISLGWFLVT